MLLLAFCIVCCPNLSAPPCCVVIDVDNDHYCRRRGLPLPLPQSTTTTSKSQKLLFIVNGSNDDHRRLQRWLMAVAAMTSLPPPSTTTTGWWPTAHCCRQCCRHHALALWLLRSPPAQQHNDYITKLKTFPVSTPWTYFDLLKVSTCERMKNLRGCQFFLSLYVVTTSSVLIPTYTKESVSGIRFLDMTPTGEKRPT